MPVSDVTASRESRSEVRFEEKREETRQEVKASKQAEEAPKNQDNYLGTA